MADKKTPSSPQPERPARSASALSAPLSEEDKAALGIGKSGKLAKPASSADDAEIKAALSTTLSADSSAALKGGEDVQFQAFLRNLLKPSTNTLDTLDPGEEFADLTPEQALKQGVLTELDILRAPITKEEMAALSVGILKNRDGSDVTYLTGKALSDLISNPMGSADLLKNFKMSTMRDAQRDIAKQYLGEMVEIRAGELHPGLVIRMGKNPEVALLVNHAVAAGNAAGINGIMYANQLWQESQFNEDAVSGAGARGISQMMPKYFMGKYGLTTLEDFHDGYKSINAGALLMADLTQKYRDQRLALVEYNGGEKAIKFVEQRLGKSQITYGDWYNFMEQRRSSSPTSDPSAWQNETFDYLKKTGAGKPTDPPVRTGTPELTPR